MPSGSHPQQHGEGILVRAQRVLQARYLCLRLRQLRQCLLHVQLAGLARLELCTRDAQALLLRVEVVLGDLDALLEGPDVQVGAGDPGGEAHQRTVVGSHRGQHRGTIGLDAAAVLAPEVQLPAGAETQLAGVQQRIQSRGDEARLCLALMLNLPGEHLLLGKQLADLHLQLRLCLQDVHCGGLQ